LNVIAEGVETREQLDFLKERECDQAQGYYFNKPISPEEIERIYSLTENVHA
jgi:diguanylate cyclase